METGHVETSYVVASIRNTLDTTDKYYDGEMQFFNRAVAQLMPVSKAFIESLLRSPFRAQFEAEYGKQLFTLAQIDQKMQSLKIVPDLIRQGNLENVYKKDHRRLQDHLPRRGGQFLRPAQAHGKLRP